MIFLLAVLHRFYDMYTSLQYTPKLKSLGGWGGGGWGSGSILFDNLIEYLKEVFEKVNFEKSQHTTTKSFFSQQKCLLKCILNAYNYIFSRKPGKKS